MALENVGDTLRCVSVGWICLMIDSAKSHESFGRDMEREETEVYRWTDGLRHAILDTHANCSINETKRN